LVVPSLNDDAEQMAAQAKWLAGINPKIPLHLTRFFPAHRLLNIPATPLATLQQLQAVAKQHLEFVYLGNV
jgi:pyruvate formate lyase activating enzyme